MQTSSNPTGPAGRELSLATTSVTIAAGQANNSTTPLVLTGVASKVDVTLSPSSVTQGTANASIAVIVNVRDADGNIIVGPYVDTNDNALTIDLADSDTSGHTQLSASSVTSSSTAVTLSYDGTNIPSLTITPTVTGGTFSETPMAGSLTISPPAAPTLATLGQNVWVTSSSATSFTETITGTTFPSIGTTVKISGSGITASNVTIVNASTITATFAVAANIATGASTTVSVKTYGGTTSSLPITIDNGAIVTSGADTMPGTPLGTGPGVAGDLRYALQNTPASDAIVFACGSPCTITLAGPLPPIEQNQIIAGGGSTQTIIEGASLYRPFFIDTGTVTIQDLQIQNGAALGGAGEAGGGGGLGAGGGIFVNQGTANVTVLRTIFQNCSAVGGAGGQANEGNTNGNFVDQAADGGGGGGLGAPGGAQTAEDAGVGSGGGGVLSAGATDADVEGFTGGGGGGGLGGHLGGETRPGGAGGAAYGSNSAGTAGQAQPSDGGGGNGGAGGFGGGGGGAGQAGYSFGNPMNPTIVDEPPGIGGNGGFGGGGGGGGNEPNGGTTGAPYNGGNGGQGGAGGGGGGGGTGATAGFPTSGDGTAGSGGTLATISGGSGNDDSGGGGAAAGPAIFVLAGTLTISQSSATGSTATGGASATSQSSSFQSETSSPGGSDSTPVFSFAGTVNGTASSGPVSSALTSSPRSPTAGEAVRNRSVMK
jgi:hypothetical protein